MECEAYSLHFQMCGVRCVSIGIGSGFQGTLVEFLGIEDLYREGSEKWKARRNLLWRASMALWV